MSRKSSVILGPHLDKFIQSEIQSGRYKTVSKVIRAGLRALEEAKRKIILINEVLVVGEQSGTPMEFDNAKFKLEMNSKLNNNT